MPYTVAAAQPPPAAVFVRRQSITIGSSAESGDNRTMSRADFHDLREILRPLSLHEVDFTVGDAFVSRIGDVKQAINQLETTGEPWVGEWLSAEHLKAGMLWTAAKTNWNREQSSGPDPTFNVRTRGAIVDRFNKWVTDLQGRLDRYERSSRTRTDVAEWRAALERFRKDPVHNP